MDTTGDDTLAWILSQLNYGDRVAACGLAGGAGLKTTVMPFILRGTSLRGVDSVYCPTARRVADWRALAADMPLQLLNAVSHSVTLEQVQEEAVALLDGRSRRRISVEL